MSRWLLYAQEGEELQQHSPDGLTKPDKSLLPDKNTPFCQVLSGCQVEASESNEQPKLDLHKKRDHGIHPETEMFSQGISFGGRPKTWTGKIVSLEEWRQLSEWEKHGPNGRMWNGITGKWEQQT